MKYEYKHIDTDITILNELGLSGWRLHTVTDTRYLLERAISGTVKKQKEYDKQTKEFTHSILKYFPIEPTNINEWYKTTDELIRIDNYNYDSIELIVKTFTSDGHWWKSRFQTYTKLRKLNKDKVKYVDYFKNTLISEKNEKDRGGNKTGATISEIQSIASKHFD